MLAAQPDTLQAVTVVADRGVVVSRTDTVSISPMQDASNLLLLIPALYVGDYGSAAGLKSASLRGFGSAHTAIYLDGVRVGNVQSGQADLGMLDYNDLSRVVVDYAQNSLSFQTARPVFNGKAVAGTIKLSGGSFGTWQPYGKLAVKLGRNWSLSGHVGGIVTNGQFPLEDGTLRANNDLKQLQAGADVFGTLEGGDFHAKVFYNSAGRGTPGSITWPSTDRQQDGNLGAQFVLKKAFSPLYTLHLSAKGAIDRLIYQSEDWGDTDYKQTEFQLNSAHKFHLQPWWEVSLAADVAFDKLLSTIYQQQRWSTVAALASAFRWERFKADVALEYAGTFDKGISPLHSLSPSADLRLTLVDGLDLVAFGRRAYRTPTFNELYYPGYGNTQLKPEDAWLTDLGVDFARSLGAVTLKANIDAYYNFLTNKIVSAPSEADPNTWLPYNVGKVQAMGTDFLVAAEYAFQDGKAGLSTRYGWQKALDKTPDSYSYNQPIPYLAAHTLVVSADAAWKGWTVDAVWHLRAGRKDATGDMPNWNTLDVTAGKTFCLGKAGSVALRAVGRNLFNQRYQVVSNYPMPGRSFLAGLEYKF